MRARLGSKPSITIPGMRRRNPGYIIQHFAGNNRDVHPLLSDDCEATSLSLAATLMERRDAVRLRIRNDGAGVFLGAGLVVKDNRDLCGMIGGGYGFTETITSLRDSFALKVLPAGTIDEDRAAVLSVQFIAEPTLITSRQAITEKLAPELKDQEADPYFLKGMPVAKMALDFRALIEKVLKELDESEYLLID